MTECTVSCIFLGFQKKFRSQLKTRGYHIETEPVLPRGPTKKTVVKEEPSFEDIDIIRDEQAAMLFEARIEGPLHEAEVWQLKKYKFLKLVKPSTKRHCEHCNYQRP